MHLHFERNSNAKCDCAILSLTWMGKVPDELPEDEGWKLNRTNYYQEGWLATGNIRGIVGVTFTTSHCKKSAEFPLRTNYNLRGHRSEVILVKWNEPYQKLASCDSSGIIFVWIKYEGRWSIELINDRNTPVTHFSWSHDGRMALICYQDGFVLVGSVAGQRYWSSMLNLDSTITCGIWTPDDQQVYFGTTSGQIIVMDVHGAMVSQVQLGSDVGITSMAWSCEKFKMEEGDDSEVGGQSEERIFILAVSLQNGYIFLMKSFDDVSPVLVHTGLAGPLCIEWSNSRELLAVAGTVQPHGTPPTMMMSAGGSAGGSTVAGGSSGETKTGSVDYINMLKFYSDTGMLLYSIVIPYTQSPVTALTWGHNDKRLFVATGCQVHIAWVSRRIASLQLMCRLRIHSQLRGGEAQVAMLPLPPRIKALIVNLFAQTIRCCVPESTALREFVSRPPSGSVRLHCTMIRHDDDTNLSSGTCYTLYLEYLGGLVPLLKGKRTSKIRPEFVIFDPQVDELSPGGVDVPTDQMKSSGSSQNAASDTSDTEREDGCGSPRVQRRKRRRNKSHGASGGGGGSGRNGDAAGIGAGDKTGDGDQDDLAYVDTLPEHIRLVEVTSNIWGTKFKIHGLASSVPANLGQVTYKTSLLHLQPRQMTLVITELRDDIPSGPDPNFNPNLFSEDEEEVFQHEENARFPHGLQSDGAPPIAPMTPRAHHTTPSASGRFTQARPKMGNQGGSCLSPCEAAAAAARVAKATASQMHQPCTGAGEPSTNPALNVPALAKAESYEDEYPYVDLTDMVHFCESLRANSTASTSPCSQSPTTKNYVESCPCPQTSNGTTYTTNVGSTNNGYAVGGVTQFSRSSVTPSTTTTQTRHAISPLVCEGAVPTLQSPKNTVAPSEVIIERQPSPQTLMASNTTTDYTGNIQRMKTTLVEQNLNRSPPGLNLNLAVSNEQNANSIDLKPVVMKRMEVDGNKLHQLINTSSIDTNSSPDNTNLISSNHPVVSPIKCASNNNTINVGKRKERSSSSKSSPSGNQIGIAGGKWCVNKQEDIQFIDDDTGESSEKVNLKSVTNTVSLSQHSPACLADSMVRSCSVGYLDLVDAQLVPCEVALMMLRKETPKRLILVNQKKQKKHKTKSQSNHESADKNSNNGRSQPPKLKHCGKSKSLDSTDIFTTREPVNKNPPSDSINLQANINSIDEILNSVKPVSSTSQNNSQNIVKTSVKQIVSPNHNVHASLKDTKNRLNHKIPSQNEIENVIEKVTSETVLKSTPKLTGREDLSRDTLPSSSATAQVMASLANLVALESLTARARDFDETHSLPPPSPCASPRLPRSSPASPAPSKKSKRNQSSSPIRKHLLNSPLLNRRQRKNKNTESSDDEVIHSGDEVFNGKNYRDLESFQKAQLRQKLKRGKFKDPPESNSNPQSPRRREFVMHNKAPMWNENSQVYQLDFGGRVTQESAKNFQIEFRGKQVMQFGRIDGNAYTLDFQYPFSALQAFAVALANVTQRLK